MTFICCQFVEQHVPIDTVSVRFPKHGFDSKAISTAVSLAANYPELFGSNVRVLEPKLDVLGSVKPIIKAY